MGVNYTLIFKNVSAVRPHSLSPLLAQTMESWDYILEASAPIRGWWLNQLKLCVSIQGMELIQSSR